MNTASEPPEPSKFGFYVAVALSLAVAVGLGFYAQRHFQKPATLTPAPAAVASTAPATDPAQGAAAAPEPKLVVPEALPAFELKDRDGKAHKLGEWTGRPMVVNFWATWCAPCRREIPLLIKLRHDRAPQKLEVVGIAVDFRDDVLKYAKERGLDYPLLMGEEDGLAAVTAMGMQANFPFTAFVDSKQRIIAMKVGELHQDEVDLILDRVAAIDAGKLDLPTARMQIEEGLQKSAKARAEADAAAAATKSTKNS